MFTFVRQAKPLVKKIFDDHDEGAIHGYPHAIEVLNHSQKGIESYPYKLSSYKKIAILLAALLHDVDDDKMFPSNLNYENARSILAAIHFPFVDLVIEMIGLVSFSKNGISDVYISKSNLSSKSNLTARTTMFSDDVGLFLHSKKRQIGTQHRIPKWKLIPRLADRVVALGTRGVGRCIGFGGQHGRPIYTEFTPRFTDVRQLRSYAIRSWLVSSIPRIKPSSIDYFIQGLIPRCFMMSGIPYFDQLTVEGTQPIIDIILLYGRQGYVTKEEILKIVQDDPESVTMIQDYVN